MAEPGAPGYVLAPAGAHPGIPEPRTTMKTRIRRSNLKRARKVGFLRRNKTKNGKKIIARQRKRYGAYRGAFRK